MMLFLPAVALFWLACAAMGAYVSHAKGRSPIEGVLFGFALGPLGVVVAALLPEVVYGGSLSDRDLDPPGPFHDDNAPLVLPTTFAEPKHRGVDVGIRL
jgi:hypothetical protein